MDLNSTDTNGGAVELPAKAESVVGQRRTKDVESSPNSVEP